MRTMMIQLRLLVVLLVFVAGGGAAQAVELLINGGLEAAPIPVPGWVLTRSVTGEPGVNVNSAQLQNFANRQGEVEGQAGLWLRGFEGNIGSFMDQNKKINAALSQTVPGMGGETYTFSGWSRWEQNYSGAVEELDILSPTGQMGGSLASPTDSIWEMAFLDASNNVLGAPVTLDLRTEQFGDRTWRQHSLMGTAPAGTANVRVTASATDMIFNIDPSQSGFYDDFSLTTGSAPTMQQLTNADLNTLPSSVVEGWTLVAGPTSTTGVFHTAAFANNTPGGATGLWLRPFVTAEPVGEAFVEQTVDATPGTNYTLTGFSKWEMNYTGATAGSPTETFLELAFLDSNDAEIGMPVMLDLRTAGQVADNMWRQFTLNAVAPAGTASVRAKAGASGMFNNVATPGSQSAFFDDLSLMAPDAGLAGDYNSDGRVDAADYVVWRKNNGSPEGYTTWRTNFGRTAGAALGAAAVPEPATCLLAAVGLSLGLGIRRRWL